MADLEEFFRRAMRLVARLESLVNQHHAGEATPQMVRELLKDLTSSKAVLRADLKAAGPKFDDCSSIHEKLHQFDEERVRWLS